MRKSQPLDATRAASFVEHRFSTSILPTHDPEPMLLESSTAYFGAPPGYTGEGGSIPFMALLGERFPEAQFLVTGVLGPESNAHGPNEFLHLPTARKLTCCIAEAMRSHALRGA
jgi:acetylornithine deacetylase/succinyl-diaminopimelate desuccinylase-like protein